MKKRKTNLSKILMYIILIMVALGFTIPGFLELGKEEEPQVRICQADADCYLMCEEKPFAVLCYHNLCQQNSCQEESLFPYQAAQNTAQLEILIEDEQLDLKEQFEKLNLNNFFVEFKEDSFTAFAPNLTLTHVLDKLRIKIDSQCLTLEEENYCQTKEHRLEMFINDNQSYAYGEYEIKNKDQIKIIYS